jgi:glutamyl-tRNA synthetase
LSRKAQLAAGRPPRYAGTCRELSAEARVRKSAQGISPTTRFRVPTGKLVEFDDMVHGPQRFATDDIGDFILRRADGSAPFFFSNAIDDVGDGHHARACAARIT